MKILALEFSANERSVAIAEKLPDGTVQLLASMRESDFRGVTGMTIIDRALAATPFKPSDISLIAIGLGPGSYTGIRSAIAIARGWQLGRNVALVGISSVTCLAEQARKQNIHGAVTIIIDAQRQELYAASFKIDSSGARQVAPLKIVAPSDLSASGKIIGPEASKFISGALDLTPSAETLARLAAANSTVTPGENLEPIYLRHTAFSKAPPPRYIA